MKIIYALCASHFKSPTTNHMRICLLGPVNSGKSFSRTTIPDGENVLIIEASYKMSYLTDSDKKPVEMLNILTKQYKGWDEARSYYKLSAQAPLTTITKYLVNKYKPGSFKRRHLPGNIVICKDLKELPDWLYFVNTHMSGKHTKGSGSWLHMRSEALS
jgi:hypothetical protein